MTNSKWQIANFSSAGVDNFRDGLSLLVFPEGAALRDTLLAVHQSLIIDTDYQLLAAGANSKFC